MFCRKWILVATIIIGAVVFVLFAPCIDTIRDGGATSYSAHNIAMIGNAIQRYYEANGHLPPAVVRSKDGKPLLSWRVLLLPFLEQVDLFNRIRFDEPWDGPHNAPLVAECPRCFISWPGESHDLALTRYQVLVGPGTAFEGDAMTWSDFPNGPANTILAVEAAESVPWAKPADIDYAPGKPLPALGAGYSQPVYFLCREVRSRRGFNACFADGKHRFIRSDTDLEVIRRLIVRNGPFFDASQLD